MINKNDFHKKLNGGDGGNNGGDGGNNGGDRNNRLSEILSFTK